MSTHTTKRKPGRYAARKRIRIYLLGGQSNMTGCCSVNGLSEQFRGEHKGVIVFARGDLKVREYNWGPLQVGLGAEYNDGDGEDCFGPEVTFGHAMAPSEPDSVIGLIKCSWGGTNLHVQWRPPSAGGKTGDLYTSFVGAVHDGITALDPAFEPEISGMIWMQGESDALEESMYRDYESNLTAFISDIRGEFKKPNLPFVVGEIHERAYKPPKWGAEVRAAQRKVVETVPNTAIFETRDLPLVDEWHYDPAGMMTLGERFAQGMKRLEKAGIK